MASSQLEKPEIAEGKAKVRLDTEPDGEHSTRRAEIEHIDAMATAEGTTLASFTHLDEKKILRKVTILEREGRFLS